MIIECRLFYCYHKPFLMVILQLDSCDTTVSVRNRNVTLHTITKGKRPERITNNRYFPVEPAFKYKGAFLQNPSPVGKWDNVKMLQTLVPICPRMCALRQQLRNLSIAQ